MFLFIIVETGFLGVFEEEGRLCLRHQSLRKKGKELLSGKRAGMFLLVRQSADRYTFHLHDLVRSEASVRSVLKPLPDSLSFNKTCAGAQQGNALSQGYCKNLVCQRDNKVALA